MTERKIIILLVLTLPLPVLWWFVKDIDQKYDWFLFYEGSQKPLWYVHYTAYHLINITTTYLLYALSKHLSKRASLIVGAFFLFSVYRLVEYWLFRFSIPAFPVIGIMLFYILYLYGKKNYGN